MGHKCLLLDEESASEFYRLCGKLTQTFGDILIVDIRHANILAGQLIAKLRKILASNRRANRQSVSQP